MIIAVVGSLIFLGIFSAGFSTVHHQETALISCNSESNTSEVNVMNFTCFDQKTTETK